MDRRECLGALLAMFCGIALPMRREEVWVHQSGIWQQQPGSVTMYAEFKSKPWPGEIVWRYDHPGGEVAGVTTPFVRIVGGSIERVRPVSVR